MEWTDFEEAEKISKNIKILENVLYEVNKNVQGYRNGFHNDIQNLSLNVNGQEIKIETTLGKLDIVETVLEQIKSQVEGLKKEFKEI